MDHMVKAERRSLLVRLQAHQRRRFQSTELESLYRCHYRPSANRRTLIELQWLLAVMFLSLSAQATYYARSATVFGVVTGLLCAAFVIQLAVLLLHRHQHQAILHRLIVIITAQLLFVFIAITLPINLARSLGTNTIDNEQRISAADGVSSLVIVLFIVYAVLPFETTWAVCVGVVASFVHLAMSAMFVDVYRDAIGQQVMDIHLTV